MPQPRKHRKLTATERAFVIRALDDLDEYSTLQSSTEKLLTFLDDLAAHKWEKGYQAGYKRRARSPEAARNEPST